ncbi:alpha/beta hydrolase [Sagittula salina]|uniref:Alpha/beta hydrolase n=1 Tax=Sagittula salina TaxID=2820268 RepID=A0A940MRP2_9RHOB|nr:alpha/beta hydrolase [Sagittula salina]MBP0483772.1 alpha/beta hydrolase [Sagittula salina]
MTDYAYAETSGQPGAPLIFTCHGTGGTEAQFHGFASEVLPEAHVISPRGDVSEHGALRYFRRRAEGLYDMADLARRTEAMLRFVEAARARTGATRVMGLGYSNGANILAAVAMAQPALFTDLALMHPLIPWQPAPAPALAGTRVLVTAGRRDPICPPDATRAFCAWLEGQGADLRTEWHAHGHEITQDEVNTVVEFLRG